MVEMSIEEMRREVKKDDCKKFGHSFDIVCAGRVPIRLICNLCGADWVIGDRIS